MEITISIINYNYGRFLRRAINSALSQDAGEAAIEVLVIDDGSIDESDSIIADYSSHKNFRSSKTVNQGFAASLNRAIKEAEGRFVFLLDADDYFAPSKVNAMLPYLRQGLYYVADFSTYVNDSGIKVKGKSYGSTSTVAVARSVALSLLPMENEISFSALNKLGKGMVLNESHTFYTYHSNSMTNRKIPGKWNTYLANVTHNLADQLNQFSKTNKLEPWGIDKRKLRKVSLEFKSQAWYNTLEASLELKKLLPAYRSFWMMLFYSLKAGKGISVLHLKMFVRTIIVSPSIPKKIKTG